MTVTVDRAVVLKIFDKLEVEHAPKIPVDRALVKLARLLAKEPKLVAGKKWSKDEREVLDGLVEEGALEAPAEPKKSKKLQVAHELEKTTPKKSKQLTPPLGIEVLMRRMLAKGRKKTKIYRVAGKKFREAGYTDEEQIQRRLDILFEWATKEEVPVKKTKKAAEEKEEKTSKKSKKPEKASKKKAAEEDDDEDEEEEEEEEEEKPKKKGKSKASEDEEDEDEEEEEESEEDEEEEDEKPAKKFKKAKRKDEVPAKKGKKSKAKKSDEEE